DGPARASVLCVVAAAPAGPLTATAVTPAAETAVTTRTENDLRALNAARARAGITRFPSDFISKSPLGRNACATPGGRRRYLATTTAGQVSRPHYQPLTRCVQGDFMATPGANEKDSARLTGCPRMSGAGGGVAGKAQQALADDVQLD